MAGKSATQKVSKSDEQKSLLIAKISAAVSIAAVLATITGTWYQARQVDLMREQLTSETDRWEREGEVLALDAKIFVYEVASDGSIMQSREVDEGDTLSAEDLMHPSETNIVLEIMNTGRTQGLIREIGIVEDAGALSYKSVPRAQLLCEFDAENETESEAGPNPGTRIVVKSTSYMSCEMPIQIEASSQIEILVDMADIAGLIDCSGYMGQDSVKLYVAGLREEPYVISTKVAIPQTANCAGSTHSESDG